MAARRESGEKRQSAIREECRVTFYFWRLGPWQPCFFVMPYFPHWSEEKSGERERRKNRKRGTRDGTDFKKEREHVQLSFFFS